MVRSLWGALLGSGIHFFEPSYSKLDCNLWSWARRLGDSFLSSHRLAVHHLLDSSDAGSTYFINGIDVSGASSAPQNLDACRCSIWLAGIPRRIRLFPHHSRRRRAVCQSSSRSFEINALRFGWSVRLYLRAFIHLGPSRINQRLSALALAFPKLIDAVRGLNGN